MAMVWLFGLVTAALVIGIGVYLRDLKLGIVLVQLTFNEGAFWRVVEKWTPEGRARFAAHFKVDYVFLVAYAAFGFFLGKNLLTGSPSSPNLLGPVLPWLLPLAATCDAVENYFHRRFLVAQPRTLPASWFGIAGTAASAKWFLIVSFILLAGVQNTTDRILWAILIILMVLVVLVGRKAIAGDVGLKPEYKPRMFGPLFGNMFAIAMNARHASEMFESWDEATKSKLRTALHWDNRFLFIYPPAYVTACLIAVRFLANKGMPFENGLIIIFLQPVAGMLDAAENFNLLKVLDGAIDNPVPWILKWCTLSKWLLIGIGWFYLLFAILFAIFSVGGTWLVLLIYLVFAVLPFLGRK